jgi:hypothetical protein
MFVTDIWKNYGFELCVLLSIFLILILAIFCRGKKGTWTKRYQLVKPGVEQSKGKDSKGEVECRRVLESIFKVPFKKCRPNMLRNPVTDGENNLEIDCYNDELKIGVEYNGVQHYKYVPYFHKTRDAYNNQKYRDHIKRELCQKNGIFLIEVPYTVKIEDIESFITNKLRLYK